MTNKAYVFERVLHWLSALFLLFMLMNLSTQLHNVDWDIKGQVEHRQDALEWHGTIGVVLLVLTLVRIIYPFLSKASIPRVIPTSSKHAAVIKVTHLALYLCIFSLVVSGLAMFNHYEIPLVLFGVEVAPNKPGFYDVFPKIHQIHMLLRDVIWWLIGIHFIGIMYAKR